jgi:hypothetical protein
LRRAALIAAALTGLLVLLPLLVMVALIGSGVSVGTVGTGGGIPAVYGPMYQAAGAEYHVNPYVLAALHQTESDYSRDPSAFKANSAGAVGPMQFLPTTWAGYQNAFGPIASARPASYPHMCAPHGCIADDFDAVAAAADYLHTLGADTALDRRTFQALVRYKGTPPASIPYAQQTFTLAQNLQTANTSTSVQIEVPAGALPTRLVTVANEIEAAQIPYCYGGGHVTPAVPTHGQYCHDATNRHISGTALVGLDCSSAVSMLLQHSGVNTPTLDSTAFMSFGQPGPGRWLTIWADPEHVFVTMGGHTWGTSDQNPYGGPGWAQHATAGFTPRHLPGL